jgi:hypothetical protein
VLLFLDISLKTAALSFSKNIISTYKCFVAFAMDTSCRESLLVLTIILVAKEFKRGRETRLNIIRLCYSRTERDREIERETEREGITEDEGMMYVEK